MIKVKGFTNDRGSIDTSINSFLEENNVVLKDVQIIEQSDKMIYALITYKEGGADGR